MFIDLHVFLKFVSSEAPTQNHYTGSAAIPWLLPTLNLNNTISASLLPGRLIQDLKRSSERQSNSNSRCLSLARKPWQTPSASLPSFPLPRSFHQESTSNNRKSLQNPFIIEREHKKQRVKLPIVTARHCWNRHSLMSSLKVSPERAELPLCFLGAGFGLYL